MKRNLIMAVSASFLLVSAPHLTAQPESTETSVTIHFDPEPVKTDLSEDGYLPRIEEIFDNSALISGLNSGADAINRSVESLMAAVFYNLMDHEFTHSLTNESWISLLTDRNVYSTATGSYVVVNKIGFGPRYAKELWRLSGIPVNLGANGSVEMIEIYPRSDAGRISEQKDLPTWRQWANNWFGILPFLTRILPPSFNPNEMYDPLRQVEAPFSFPLTISSFNTMPIGSIRSYGVSGGVQLPVAVGDALSNKTKALLSKFIGSKAQLPYKIFSVGSHRINVLRRDTNLAWVGLSTVNRTGQSVAGIIGNTLFLMGNAIKKFPWTGVPVPIFPIDVELAGTISKQFDQLYEYDLRKPAAVSAYLAAVKGDFTPSFAQHNLRKQGLDTGVRYHFTKIKASVEATAKNSSSVFVAHKSHQQIRSKSDIEIRDESGIFFVLEGVEDQQNESWDVLVGSEESRIRNQVDLQVDRTDNIANESDKYKYTLKKTASPIGVTINYQITDRYTDSREYREYIDEMEQFSQLTLSEAPNFPILDEASTRRYRMASYLEDPNLNNQMVPPTPIVLGRFNANAAIAFDTMQIDHIAAQSTDAMWGAFATAFGMDAKIWGDPNLRSEMKIHLLQLGHILLYPLRILNTRFATIDAIHEVQNSITALSLLRAATSPVAKLEAFYQLFESDHPRITAAALLLLSDLDHVPRKIDFYSRPVSYLDPAYRVKFQKLNGLTVRSAFPFPKAERYEIANDKLNAFFPTEMKEQRTRPIVRNIEIATKTMVDLIHPEKPHNDIYVRLQIEKMEKANKQQVYVRFSQAGKVQFGKLIIAEDVLPLKSASSTEVSPGAALGTTAYDFFISGPNSPLDSFILSQALDFGGEFLLALSVTSDGVVWSEEKEVHFRFENGALFPAE